MASFFIPFNVLNGWAFNGKVFLQLGKKSKSHRFFFQTFQDVRQSDDGKVILILTGGMNRNVFELWTTQYQKVQILYNLLILYSWQLQSKCYSITKLTKKSLTKTLKSTLKSLFQWHIFKSVGNNMSQPTQDKEKGVQKRGLLHKLGLSAAWVCGTAFTFPK